MGEDRRDGCPPAKALVSGVSNQENKEVDVTPEQLILFLLLPLAKHNGEPEVKEMREAQSQLWSTVRMGAHGHGCYLVEWKRLKLNVGANSKRVVDRSRKANNSLYDLQGTVPSDSINTFKKRCVYLSVLSEYMYVHCVCTWCPPVPELGTRSQF